MFGFILLYAIILSIFVLVSTCGVLMLANVLSYIGKHSHRKEVKHD